MTVDGARDAKSKKERNTPRRGKKMPRSYEFGSAHEAQFLALARKMRIVGAIGIGWVLLAAVSGLVKSPDLAPLLEASTVTLVIMIGVGLCLAVALAVAVWTLRAARSFRSIAETSGRDIDHLMAALREVDRLYLVQVVFTASALLVFVLTFVRAAIAASEDSRLMQSIFEIKSYTNNDSACEPGDSAMSSLNGETFLFLFEAESPLGSLTSAVTCKSPDDCREKMRAWKADDVSGSRVLMFFDKRVDATHREGTMKGPGSNIEPGKCSGAQIAKSSLVWNGKTLVLEERTTSADVPTDPPGSNNCSTAVAERELAGKPCGSLKVITAELREPL